MLGRAGALEIFHTIDAGADAPPPRADPATATLVVEGWSGYLAFAGYGHALSVFEPKRAPAGASITRAQISTGSACAGTRSAALPCDVVGRRGPWCTRRAESGSGGVVVWHFPDIAAAAPACASLVRYS